MIYFSDHELDDLLLEDIYRGDLTTQALGLGDMQAEIRFMRKNAGVVAGVDIAEKLLKKLDLDPLVLVQNGEYIAAGTLLCRARGWADRLHQAWKMVQLVLEWSCGVAHYTFEMVQAAKQVNPQAVVACTRKSIPNTRKLATAAVLAGGGHIHRQGLSESVLLFTNHRNLCADPDDYAALVAQLKRATPENKITLEADNPAQFRQMLAAAPDIIQLDKFSVEQAREAFQLAQGSGVQLSVAGGVNRQNVAQYAETGISLFITSAPYYATPEDIKVIIDKCEE